MGKVGFWGVLISPLAAMVEVLWATQLLHTIIWLLYEVLFVCLNTNNHIEENSCFRFGCEQLLNC